MSAESSRKTIPAWLWIIPVICLAAFTADRFFVTPAPPAPPPTRIKVPVEVVVPGEPTKVIYIDVQADAIPEPSTMLLVPLAGVLLFRRQR